MPPARWTESALADLAALADFIGDENPAAALEMLEKIVAATKALTELPSLGRPGRVPNTRELVLPGTPYLLPYRSKKGRVEILRVLHSSRRWPEDFL